MARKGKLKIDIESSDNILLEIVKHGKIPVIRYSDKGFQNYKQDKYFDRYNEENCFMYRDCFKSSQEIFNGKKPAKGCFVCLGGVHTAGVIAMHEYESINIGYIEPDTKVFITYVPKNSKLEPFSYVTAKERFEDTLNYFKSIKNFDKYDFDNFDVLSEAIVNTKDIFKVSIIDDEKIFFKKNFNKDKNNFFKIIEETLIFYRIVHKVSSEKGFPKEFLKAIDKERILKTSFLSAWEDEEYGFCDMVYFDGIHKKLFLEAYQDYVFKDILNTSVHNYLDDLEYLENIFKKNSLISVFNFSVYPDKDELSLRMSIKKPYFIKDDFFGSFNGEVFFNKKGNNVEFSYRKDAETFDKPEKIDLNNLLKPSFRKYLFEFLNLYDEYVKVISKYIDFVESDFIKVLKIFKDSSDFLENYEYSLNLSDYNYKISFSDKFKLEYNFILNDFVLELGDNFYNLENIPDEKDLTDFVLGFKNYFEEKFVDFKKDFVLKGF